MYFFNFYGIFICFTMESFFRSVLLTSILFSRTFVSFIVIFRYVWIWFSIFFRLNHSRIRRHKQFLIWSFPCKKIILFKNVAYARKCRIYTKVNGNMLKMARLCWCSRTRWSWNICVWRFIWSFFSKNSEGYEKNIQNIKNRLK